jgi:radical SAM superfamily enzyme YgiQ (UPF0313 family)
VSERRGDEVRICDLDVEEGPISQVVAEYGPDLVGITANTIQIRSAWEAAGEVKAVREVPVVLGGPHPTILREESLAEPGVDMVVRGEGEATWVDLCDHLEREAPLEGVPGLSFTDDGRRVIHNPDRAPIADLDTLPYPAYHLFRTDRYTNLQPAIDHREGAALSILTSRGCPYRCIYCSQIGPRKWRMRSPENLVDEWRWLVRDRGATEIGVLDDSFNIDRQRVLDLCDRLIGEGLNRVPWIMINGIRANLVDEELLGRMREAGCIRTAFGVESGNQEILDRVIDKHQTLDQVREAFRAAKAVGMETIGFFIIGLPGETEKTMDDTIRFAIELDPLVANFSMATPFPGTELERLVREKGRMLVEDWDDFAFFENKPSFEMEGLSAELVERKWQEAYRRFYLRPSRIFRIIRRKRTWLNLPQTVRMAWRTLAS